MKLSELITGQEASITGMAGDSAIKRRLNEMGFIPGRKIKAIKAAPLKDPVEYEIMDYKITIRQKDAALVTIAQDGDAIVQKNSKKAVNWMNDENRPWNDNPSYNTTNSKTITVALVGNPNCGKTTIFNYATNSRERVANYAGVTVAAKEARLEIGEYTLNVIDLPGTYSLSSYSPEEMFVADYLLRKKPDIVINVIDAGNLERNLFLTTQLLDCDLKTIVALNMYDELETANCKLDYKKFGQMLGMPFIPTVGTQGKGLKELFNTVVQVHTNQNKTIRSVHVPYSIEIEKAINDVLDELKKMQDTLPSANRFMVLQLLENDPNILAAIPEKQAGKLNALGSKKRRAIEQLLPHDFKTETVNFRYGFIEGALAEIFQKGRRDGVTISQKIDRVLTHKLWGLPVFFGIIWFMFYATFTLGEFPMNWIDGFFGWLGGMLNETMAEGIFNSLLVEGVIGGVGGVIVFLPNIMILFFLISIMEDSGYMARTAFLMDKAMHRAGLHGKSFIPLLMGFGCNVPAVMATRTIESKRDRLVTMFITPFMSCSARLPVYVLFISAFFPRFESFILFSMYLIGILAALVTAVLLNNTVFRKTESPFVMELPPYRQPTVKAVTKHTWFKTSHFIKKMGTVILFASILVWALGYFPQNKEIISRYEAQIAEKQANLWQSAHQDEKDQIGEYINELETQKQSELLEQSYISRIGKAIQTVFEPLGFDWRMSVSILTGIMAKEVVVSSMGVLYHVGADVDETSASLVEKLRNSQSAGGMPLIAYFGFLVFTLLYFPCMGTLIAIKKETGRFGWTLFAAAYPLVFAWGVTFMIYQAGTLF